MREKWTGEVIGALHVHERTCQDLAKHMGINDKYLSAILNGHRVPKDAERKVMAALAELLKEE
jgi:DNA-binding HxlR family transcriptional regulator